ncbi:MAG: permease, partial [Paracoccaceae bacterium]
MAENTHSHPNPLKVDSALAALAVILLGAALFNFEEFSHVAGFALKALANTAPFIFFAVLAVAYVKATGAENVLAKAFEGAEARMVILAALLGGLSPFCSCEVIPFIAALLAVGAPLSAVMAFWLASPLMDPAMFLITSGTLGWEFALGKSMAAVGIGLFGGAVTMIFAKSVVFADPLREKPKVGGCCGVKAPFQD